MLDIINPEFDIKIGDRVFKLKALSLNSLIKLSRSLKQKETMANAEEMCKHLPKEQRGKFMLDVLQQLGKSQSLEEELQFADSLFTSILGIIEIIKYGILKNNKISEEELDNLIDSNFTTEYFEYMSGIAAKVIGIATESDESEVEDTPDEDKPEASEVSEVSEVSEEQKKNSPQETTA